MVWPLLAICWLVKLPQLQELERLTPVDRLDELSEDPSYTLSQRPRHDIFKLWTHHVLDESILSAS